jgi:hypothetical protein
VNAAPHDLLVSAGLFNTAQEIAIRSGT